MNSFRLLLLGAPGSGKGTITKKLKNVVPNLQSIASGDLLRREIQEKTSLGQIASKYISQGKLIPDDLIISLVANHIGTLSHSTATPTTSWLLDGFPRTLRQAIALDNILKPRHQNLTKVIELKVPESAILGRIETRYVHIPSGRIYNLSYNPPKVPGFDDVTGEPLVKRSDDNEETIVKRLKDYNNMVKPLRQFYKDEGILTTVHGDTSDFIFPQVLQTLEDHV
ncbi:similar to Saccharomyces cerevisiae YER170W ADK2 Mitochondrial adenylate kinase, catalyzes the reversible synthesis of GTP and AMP from GDP and ADP [Maudiozyma saulgeensis]|uniref:GTP:AMP phosphotransferase, mitochondrial n=1 Tax=Maudiozyma saulgeensis TaxID=1789683 RepID=A0A1X7R7T1_9SACH|nr:similar to Saccharomyces cerevisiae YER170W ADK2 Mitochondrial adenylate kinase, catalyzes the reversible synthesis of GTP and AMP from GDP and ADP [Kazachstania saulgeensis]